jgi:hypothetical protein
MAFKLTLPATQSGECPPNLCGHYQIVELGPKYEFAYNSETQTYKVKQAIYRRILPTMLKGMDFGDSIIFSCVFKYGANQTMNYNPEKGLRYWKIQRQVYRLINNIERIIETSLYHDGDIFKSQEPTPVNVAHAMEIPGNKTHYLHFEYMSATDRLNEIIAQCQANNIECTIKLRTRDGTCYEVSTSSIE